MPQSKHPALGHYGLGNGEAPPNPGAGLTDWAVPWSDVMMCLCVVFVVLFVYASTHKDVTILFKPEEVPSAKVMPSGGTDAQVDRLTDSRLLLSAVTRPGAADGREILYRSADNGVTVVREADGDMRLTLRGDLFFGQGQAALNPGAAPYLKELADILRVNEGLVHVIGFTDEGEGDGAAGFDLALKRAMNVARHFLDVQHLDPRRFYVSARGGYRPEVPATVAGSAERNRRVEILLINGSQTQGGQP